MSPHRGATRRDQYAGRRRWVVDNERDRRTGPLVAGNVDGLALQGVRAVGDRRAVPVADPAVVRRGPRGDQCVVQRSTCQIEVDTAHIHVQRRCRVEEHLRPDTVAPLDGITTLVVGGGLSTMSVIAVLNP